jgi:hypothetical protein
MLAIAYQFADRDAAVQSAHQRAGGPAGAPHGTKSARTAETSAAARTETRWPPHRAPHRHRRHRLCRAKKRARMGIDQPAEAATSAHPADLIGQTTYMESAARPPSIGAIASDIHLPRRTCGLFAGEPGWRCRSPTARRRSSGASGTIQCTWAHTHGLYCKSQSNNEQQCCPPPASAEMFTTTQSHWPPNYEIDAPHAMLLLDSTPHCCLIHRIHFYINGAALPRQLLHRECAEHPADDTDAALCQECRRNCDRWPGSAAADWRQTCHTLQ